MSSIFDFVSILLNNIAIHTGLTYNEINIIAYYFIIPYTWIILADKIFKFHYLKIAFGIVIISTLILIDNFSAFCDWLFHISVAFLLFFGDYIVSSVIICVFLVMVIYSILIYFSFFHKKHNLKKTFKL